MSLTRRLRKLEQRTLVDGCEACRGRQLHQVVMPPEFDALPVLNLPGLSSGGPCPECQREVDVVIEVVYAERQAGSGWL